MLNPDFWWSEITLRPSEGLKWILGSLDLVVYRSTEEWLVAHQSTERPEDDSKWQLAAVSEPPEDYRALMRFVTAASGNKIRLRPCAADRSVVVRPRVPLHILPGERSKIYVSSPAWVDVRVGKPGQTLCEVPVKRLSDTWFGPSTLEGEIAYALKTQARVEIAEVPRRSYRLITPTEIRNRGDDVLLIDRINLPVPYLSVYATPDGTLWSNSVKLEQGATSELASLKVREGAPGEAKSARRLSAPRLVAEKNFLVRAFIDLLNPFEKEV